MHHFHFLIVAGVQMESLFALCPSLDELRLPDPDHKRMILPLFSELLQEKKVAEIARLRCVEVVTIKTQIKGLLHKFGCTRTKEIVKMIRQMNLEHLFQ